MKIILASKSPRRTEILNEFGISHEVIPSTSDEQVNMNQTVECIVEDISYSKAIDVFKDHNDDLVIGADTIVVVDNEILGKPKDEKDAVRMLSLLQGRSHKVITGVSIITKDKKDIFHDVSIVTFKPMTKEDILTYIHSDNVYDKAGSYAIQSKHATFIEKYEGSYYNIVGLPIEKIKDHLSEMVFKCN